MEQLAAAGGVTKPILYRHFGDREGLVATIGSEFAAQLLTDIFASLGSNSSPRALLDSTINTFVEFIERDPALYRFLSQHTGARPDGAKAVAGLIETISRQVADVLAEGLTGNGFDVQAAAPWAYGIVGMVHQAADWWLEEQTMSRPELVKHLSDLLWNGLDSAGSPHDRGAES